jgi:hypothetical protein
MLKTLYQSGSKDWELFPEWIFYSLLKRKFRWSICISELPACQPDFSTIKDRDPAFIWKDIAPLLKQIDSILGINT